MGLRIAGKVAGLVLGGGIGFAAGGGPGLVAGLVIGLFGGVLVDRALGGDEPGIETEERAPTREEIDAEARRLFARHLCSVFVAVAAADGEVRREEIRTIRDFFAARLGFQGAELDLVRSLLKELVDAPPTVEVAALAAGNATEPSVKLLLAQALYELSIADGPLTHQERQVLDRAIRGLGVSDADHSGIRVAFIEQADTAYELLGLPRDASPQEIKSRYRQLAATHHPDKVAHLGPQASKVAEAKFTEISQAYEQIRQERGF